MWVFIWVILSGFVIGIFLWSQYILYQQKKAWQAYAKSAGLNYTEGKFTDPPVVSGLIKGRRISFYTAIQQTADIRGQRFVTVIEIELGPGLPTSAAIATKEYSNFLSSLKLSETLEIEPDNFWDQSYLIKTRDKGQLAAYLDEDRRKALHAVFSMRSSMALFFFDEQEAVLRVETSDPLRSAEHMEKIARKICAVADKLAPPDQEKKRIPAVKPKQEPEKPTEDKADGDDAADSQAATE